MELTILSCAVNTVFGHLGPLQIDPGQDKWAPGQMGTVQMGTRTMGPGQMNQG